MASKQQSDLVREQFTRTAQVFGDYAVASRVGEAERLARMVTAAATDRGVDLEASMADDAAAFHPRFAPGSRSGKESELLFDNTTLFIAAEKI